jgi:hypothetical protein
MRTLPVRLPRKSMLFVLAASAIGAGSVIASGFPSENGALSYSGRLTDSAGNPRTTTESISVTLFSAVSGGQSLCAASQPAVDLSATQGRFHVPLPELCLDAITDTGDVWAEVKVGATTLPRQKLGAVPFAVSASEAQHAETADAADIATTVAPSGVSAAAIQDGAVNSAKLAPSVMADLDAIRGRLGALEDRQRPGGLAYSPHAVWKGSGPATNGRILVTTSQGVNLTGYRAAKYICEQTLGSPTAHMCTSEEAARSAQLGLVPPDGGWIATGTATGDGKRDCQGFTNGTSSAGGVVWIDGTYGTGAWDWPCQTLFKIQCCD